MVLPPPQATIEGAGGLQVRVGGRHHVGDASAETKPHDADSVSTDLGVPAQQLDGGVHILDDVVVIQLLDLSHDVVYVGVHSVVKVRGDDGVARARHPPRDILHPFVQVPMVDEGDARMWSGAVGDARVGPHLRPVHVHRGPLTRHAVTSKGRRLLRHFLAATVA